jgi:hypothetical protein
MLSGARCKWDSLLFSALVAFGVFLYQAFLLLIVGVLHHLWSVFDGLQEPLLVDTFRNYGFALPLVLPLVFFAVQWVQRLGRLPAHDL